MGTLQDAGRILQGAAAGMQGQGEQWRRTNVLEQQYKNQNDRADRKEQTDADIARQKTLFTDSLSQLNFFNMGRYDLVEKLGNSRLQLGAQNHPNIDFTTPTGEITELAKLAQSPDPKVAKQAQDLLGKTLNNGVQVGVGLGILKKDSLPGADDDAPSNVREWKFYEGLSPTDQNRFLEMKRAQKLIDMGGGAQGVVTGTGVTPVTGSGQGVEGFRGEFAATEGNLEGIKSAAAEGGRLAAQWKLKPAVEAAVTEAVAVATQASIIRKEERSNAIAYKVYDTAMSSLGAALHDTSTGPFVGWLPSLTTNQQIADGAVAAMAPILKQIFRSAGEGTFTDSDQKLLIEMLATRADSPEARISKIRSIDAIVRAKLNMDGQSAPVGAGGPSQEDLEHTAQKYGITVEQVKEKLGM